MARDDTFTPFTGPRLLLAGLLLGLTNFMVVLDTTIANVSVGHIAGSLGVSTTQGTWVITSYAVAEAICVPLTGWLAGRFGTVRTFIVGMIGFGIFSVLCGLSTSLTMIVAARIGQGLCGGPLMPLTQTMLLRIFPREKHGAAMGLWAMTTVTAPILGPILGGSISDSWSWHWIFFINVPIALLCIFGALRLLVPAETLKQKLGIDTVGLVLLVVWIGALQIMLDIGREHDWFEDPTIIVLALVALVGGALFIAWELTEEHPIVDLRVFRHRGYVVAVGTLSFAFATFFATVVLIPQWLQGSLGYTSTYAGYATAFTGMGAVIMSPIVPRLMKRYDPRALVCFGILWLGLSSLLRVHWTSGADFWSLAFPQMVQGFGMPFFFIPLTTIALAAVQQEETASAAGLMSFLRTMGGAIGTSLSTTLFANNISVARSEMVGRLNEDTTVQALQGNGFSPDQVRAAVEQLVTQESSALAITHMFLLGSIIFVVAASAIWLAPRPKRLPPPGAAH
ncbi:multidrug resistance protein B [Croceibacterium mercuriale]|uniref:Multidrug resistance protein B n=1 Tax=Croceibacterium mercuriale TaxID=1572751 RepID=A0A0B2BY66_9SPHN|nr:DHA2 family efflux MFS transporter permease subunit [Croceibacterium mercuriale]KHL24755.1 multidrug resistance protein B [Croceibacterium mercuriale]